MTSSTVVTTPRSPASNRSEPPPLLALVLAAIGHPEGRITLLGTAGAVGLLVAMFWSNILHFAFIWASDENYSHGFLVPLISVYFANEAARRRTIAAISGTGLGIGLILGSILGRLVTVVVPVGFVGDLSLLVGLAGVVALLFGWGALRRFGFALGFLIFMIPLPVALYAQIATPLQLAVSRLASILLNISHIPALCEGNMITLPGDNKMFVAEACSGMRQLTGFLALTTAWAYLMSRPVWYRAVLISTSIPIAMTANIVRVTLTGAITYHIDPQFASGVFHTAEGLLMMAFGLLILYAGCRVLDRIVGETIACTRPTLMPSTTEPEPR